VVWLIWLCLFLTMAGCAGNLHTGSPPANTPGILDRWHFKTLVEDFERCALERLAERASGPSGGGSVVRAMGDCRELLYRLYPAMEASGCCTPHYIEGYVQGSWGAVRRRLETKQAPPKGL
jgi:predicted RNA-binding Zn ribbon-like protein